MSENRNSKPCPASEATPPIRAPSVPELPFLLTADEVATLLRTSRDVVWDMARKGLLPKLKIGRKVLFRRDGLLQFLRDRESSVSSLGDG